MYSSIALGYGQVPLQMPIDDHDTVVMPPTCGQAPALDEILEESLANPVGSLPLERLAAGRKRILIIVSDDTRKDPRASFIKAIVKRLPRDSEVRVAVATGTHGPSRLDGLGLPSSMSIVNHDGHGEGFARIGTTSRGTDVLVNPCLLEADLVVATGCIRPHYFAGYGAGVKAIFPGLGEAMSIRSNHLLKTTPKARPGVVEGNACRDDLEEVLGMLACPAFLLNGVQGSDGQVHHIVAGEIGKAFRVGADLCRPLFAVKVQLASSLVISGGQPTTDSLYQACKLLAAVAEATKPNSHIILVAECSRGIGPVKIVNEAIYQLGIAPRLKGAHVVLVSSLPADSPTLFCSLAPSLQRALDARPGPRLIIPQADSILVECT